MKRIPALIILSALLLTACGGGAGEETTPITTASSEPATEITEIAVAESETTSETDTTEETTETDTTEVTTSVNTTPAETTLDMRVGPVDTPTEDNEQQPAEIISETLPAEAPPPEDEDAPIQGSSFLIRTVYPAMSGGRVETSFRNKSDKTYAMNFTCWLEAYRDGEWVKVEPLGKLEQANGASPFERGPNKSQTCFLDLACYPLLPAGYYRIAKPYGEVGGELNYTAYSQFELRDNVNPFKLSGSGHLDAAEYPPNVSSMRYDFDYSGFKDEKYILSLSEIFDIEKKVGGNWVSVRKSPVEDNSIGGSYPAPFSTRILETSGFDTSEPGEYRVRLSVGTFYFEGRGDDVYETWYAPFRITGSAPMGNVAMVLAAGDYHSHSKRIVLECENFVPERLTVKSAVIEAGGKSVTASCGSTLPANCDGPYRYDTGKCSITLKPDGEIPTGRGKITLTLSGKGYADKTVTVPITVRAATEQEKNAGVFFTCETNLPLSPEKITFKVDNKTDEEIVINVGIKSGEDVCGYTLSEEYDSRESRTVAPGQSKEFTLEKLDIDAIIEEWVQALKEDSAAEEASAEEVAALEDVIREMLGDMNLLDTPGEYTLIIEYESQTERESAEIELIVNN